MNTIQLPKGLNSFETISLQEMGNATLMDRVDTKYVFDRSFVPIFLGWLSGSYKVLEINNHRSVTYDSLYFDTPTLGLYHDHHCGKRNRLKIRFRNYAENNLTFFEIKSKTNRGRTFKGRIGAPQIERSIRDGAKQFLETQTNLIAANFNAVLSIKYKRITLVHRHSAERITIDTDTTFENKYGVNRIAHLAIAEVKQEKSGSSPFAELMKANSIREGFMSKYCFGMACLVPGLRHNNFKPLISKLNKTTIA